MAASVVVAQESQLRSSFYPGHLILLIRSAGDLPVIAAVRVHDENFAITLVLRYTVVCYRIRNFLSVGRYRQSSDTSHCPKGFRRHTLPFDLNIGFFDKHLIRFARVFCSAAGS